MLYKSLKKRYTARMISKNNLIYQWVGSIAALLCVCAELRAEYEPPVNVEDYPRESVRAGQMALRAMSQLLRDAYIAESLGLIFLESGAPAYEKEVKGSYVKYHPVLSGGKMVISSGKAVSFYKERDKAMGKGKIRVANEKNCSDVGKAIGEVGDEVIFSGVKRDVTRVVQQYARYNLKLLPRKRREAFLANWGELLYLRNGESAYGATKYDRSIWPTRELKQKQEWKEVNPEAMFIDTTGEELSYEAVIKEFDSSKYRYACWISQWCINLVGANDILGLFPKEMKALSAAYEKKMQELGFRVTELKEDKDEEVEKPRENYENR